MPRSNKALKRVHFSAIMPPTAIYAGCIAFGIVLEQFYQAGAFPIDALRVILSVCAVVAGGILLLFSWRAFRRNDQTFSQRTSSTRLVEDGPYAYSRNPVYLSYILLTLAIGAALNNAWILCLIAPATALVHFGVVRREEHYLSAKFGEVYKRYRLRVNRWI